MRLLRRHSPGVCELVSRNTTLRLFPFAVALLVVLADRLSKLLIQRSITPLDSISILPGWLRIIHTENTGAAFGVLADGNAFVRAAVLVGVSTLVLLFVISALWNQASGFQNIAARLGLGLILGGAAGNLFDRVLYGRVTDFIEVYRGAWSFPAFNIADSAITVGAVLLILDLVRPHRKRMEDPELVHK